MPFTLVLHINCTYLLFQEAGVPKFQSRLCTSAQLCLQRIYHIQPQTACPLHGKRTCPKGHDPQITCDSALTGCKSCISGTRWFFSGTSGMQMSASSGVIRRTGEDSRRLPTVIFCHIIADVTSCVTRCKEAFNIERPKLRIDTDERTLDIVGSVVDYREVE